MTEKTFTVVGTAINADGTIKVRWANDLVARIKILDKAGCTDIDLIELDEGMTKLDAAEYFYNNKEGLTDDQKEILAHKIAEKSKMAKRAETKVTISGNIDTAVKTGKETDPKVAAFIEKELSKA